MLLQSMESIATIRLNRAFALALLTLTIGAFFTNTTPPSSASAYHLIPYAKFYLNFQNRLSDTGSRQDEVMLQCKKLMFQPSGSVATRPLAIEWITPNSNWGFSFMTSWVDVIHYSCEFHCLGINGYFSAFADTAQFEDDFCGGRHCNWMFNNDGVFLYNLKEKRYHKRISFKPPPAGVNNGTSHGKGGDYSFRYKIWKNSTGDGDIQG